ncbi:MAG TPA: hypothetical protein EYH12_03965 [Psychromonas hadalis]|nr:hypothetical protein [Psychromonas hadalis]
MKKLLLTTLTVLSMSAYAVPSCHNWNDGSSDPFAAAISAAEAGYAANLKVNMAWRDTGKMIKEAKKLSATPCSDAALALANKAHTQTVNATTQTSVIASSPGPRF